MSDRILVSTRKGLFDVRRGANGWGVHAGHFVGDNCTLARHDARDGAIYACLDHGHFGCKMHRSDDDGSTWTEIAVPVYPQMPEGYEPAKHPMSGKVIEWKLKLLWALEPAGDDRPGSLWCGTIPGGLFRSDDRGASWNIVRSLWDKPEREAWFGGGFDEPGIHSVCVDPRDSDHIVVGISCGGAWRSTDAGATWSVCSKGMRAEYMPPERAYDENIQDPHLVARCRDTPDAMWVQHHNGIFRTTDNAATWTEIESVRPSGFGFAVAAHPTDPDTAWFVPAIKDEKRIPVDGNVIVTRTRDGGQSFDQLTNGLPQGHAYDIVFRHALHVDGSGERLAMGSTTGNLWISENGGDDWATVTSYLPPVYAVSFA